MTGDYYVQSTHPIEESYGFQIKGNCHLKKKKRLTKWRLTNFVFSKTTSDVPKNTHEVDLSDVFIVPE